MFRLDGKQALVTGGSRGIGLGIARGLAEAGADVILTARGADALENARSELANTGKNITVAPFDVNQAEAIPAFMDELAAAHDGIDILVNNAGINRREAADTQSLEDWTAIIETNLTATFVLSQAFARNRIARKLSGRIINIGSIGSSRSRPKIAAYAASKGGVLNLTRGLAVDWAPHDILVNCVEPGFVETPMTEVLKKNPDFVEWVELRCPLKRWATPKDIAGAVVFLASPAASYITGQAIVVDGGLTANM
jgi:gluconate 5-dehydrogenase